MIISERLVCLLGGEIEYMGFRERNLSRLVIKHPNITAVN